MRIEIHNGNKIVCGHIYDCSEIKSGQRWQSSGNSIVTIHKVNYETKEVLYWYMDNGKETYHTKDSFSFQCRYCLIIEKEQE